MTCIIGIETEQGVILAGDTQGTSNHDVTDRLDGKVFEAPCYIDAPRVVIGFTSSYRMGQLLRYVLPWKELLAPEDTETEANPWRLSLSVNPRHDRDAAMRWMVTKFIPAVRKTMKDNGYLKVENNEETGGMFLVGIEQFLFCVSGDMQVAMSANGFDACGSGYAYALGAVHSSLPTPEHRDDEWATGTYLGVLLSAMRAAAHFNSTVGGNVQFVSSGNARDSEDIADVNDMRIG